MRARKADQLIPALLHRVGAEITHFLQASWSFKEIEAHYDSLASDYDEINAGVDSYYRRFTDALQLTEIPNNAYFLDVCARTGNGTAFFFRRGKVGKVICADVSHAMGRLCVERLREIGMDNFRWLHISDYSWPLADGEFEVVISFESVEHFADPQCFISELGRVTRPGGTLLLSTPNVLWEPVHAFAAIVGWHHSEGPHRFIPLPELRGYLSRAGFEIQHFQTTVLIPKGPQWLIETGKWLEERLSARLRTTFGLRRIFVCRKLI